MSGDDRIAGCNDRRPGSAALPGALGQVQPDRCGHEPGISGAGPICDGVSGSVPFPELMNPSWLLAEYDLRVTGQSEHLGRSAYAIAGSPRLASDRAHRAAAAAAADGVSALAMPSWASCCVARGSA